MDSTKTPRICLLIGNFHPVVGGGEKHALSLGRELIRQGTRITVLTRRRGHTLPAREIVMGIPVVRVGPCGFPRLGKYLMIPAVMRELRRERDNFDVIYVCGLRVLGFVGAWAARRLGWRCVLRAEALGEMSGDFIWRRHPGAPVRPLLKALAQPLIRWRNRWLPAKIAAFVSISTPVREEYLACGVPADRIYDITNGIDLAEFAPADAAVRRTLRTRLSLPLGQTIGAYAGKLNHGKGLQFLIKLWAQITATRPDLHLLLIGGGGGQATSCEAELRTMIDRLDMAEKITITGYTQNVPDYLRAADFFVFPSASETLGLALIEALACELPAVASRIPGITDIIDDGVNGWLARLDSTDEWTRAIEQLLADTDRARAMARAGRQSVHEKFSIVSDAKRHRALFASLC